MKGCEQRFHPQQKRLEFGEEPRDVGRGGGIATQNPVLAEEAQVPSPRGRPIRDRGHSVCAIVLIRVGEKAIDFVRIESGEIQVEIKPREFLKLRPEKLQVPIRLLVRIGLLL